MNAPALLKRFRAAGVVLSAEGAKLHWRAPTGVMTPERVEAMRQAKPHLLRLLEAEEERARDKLRATYRRIGEAVPAGALAWADQHRPALMTLADEAQAAINAALASDNWAALDQALSRLTFAMELVAAAYRGVQA